jgi:hypothetical protein
MLHAMSVRSVLGFSLAVVVAAPFGLFACEGKRADGGADAAVVVATPAVPVAPAAPDTGNAAAATPVAPLGAAAPVAPAAGGVKPAVATDGGKPVAVADAGPAVTDGGKAAPAPTPTFAIPTAIPGFDAGGFKPPAGFPSTIPTTLPTFPPPAK